MRGPRTAMKSGPRLTQLEKALAQKRRPNTAINKKNKFKKKNETLKKKKRVYSDTYASLTSRISGSIRSYFP